MPEETLRLWVYEQQEPLLRSTGEMEPRYGRLQAILKRLNIRSTCALPLTTAHRKLGVITFCSKQVDTYSPNDIRFVSQVTDYIALAFDDALNFAALQRASEELQSKNDRFAAAPRRHDQVVSNLELRDLLRAISQGVRRVMQCDYAGLSPPGCGKTAAATLRPGLSGGQRVSSTKSWFIRSRDRPPVRHFEP